MSELIRVCLVSVNSYPLFNEVCKAPFGGAELQVFLLAKTLAQDPNYKVSVIVGDFGQSDVEYHNNVTILKAHSRKGGFTGKLLAPFKILQMLATAKPNVIIQRASGPETGICAFYSQRKKVRFIYSVASDAEMLGKSVASSHFIYNFLYKYGLAHADTIVVQSERQLHTLNQLNEKLSAKATVIKNSIEIVDTSIDDRKHLLWVGRTQSCKRPQTYIDLANEIRDENFVMVMPSGEVTDEVDRLVRNATSTPNIQFLSRVDFRSSQELFNNAKMLVNTSSWEGFPNTFLQAGIASIPVVSLEVDPDSFIERNNCGYVCGGDFSILVKKVKSYLDNDAARENAGNNCHNYVIKHHDIRNNIEIWKKLIVHENAVQDHLARNEQ